MGGISNVLYTPRSLNDSVTSSEIRDEAELLLRGDLDPSDSMSAFLDGEIPKHHELVTFLAQTFLVGLFWFKIRRPVSQLLGKTNANTWKPLNPAKVPASLQTLPRASSMGCLLNTLGLREVLPLSKLLFNSSCLVSTNLIHFR